MRSIVSVGVALTLAFGFTRPAEADVVLLDLEDPASQVNTAESLPFTATAASTTISFLGYEVPAFLTARDINLTLTGGGPNLLGLTWAFTPAPSGSSANQFNDGFGSGTNALGFGDAVEDSFDMFSQTFASAIGQSYTINFLLTNGDVAGNAPSELIVSVNTDPAGVPEPTSIAFLGLVSLGAAGYGWRRRKNAMQAVAPCA